MNDNEDSVFISGILGFGFIALIVLIYKIKKNKEENPSTGVNSFVSMGVRG